MVKSGQQKFNTNNFMFYLENMAKYKNMCLFFFDIKRRSKIRGEIFVGQRKHIFNKTLTGKFVISQFYMFWKKKSFKSL